MPKIRFSLISNLRGRLGEGGVMGVPTSAPVETNAEGKGPCPCSREGARGIGVNTGGGDARDAYPQ